MRLENLRPVELSQRWAVRSADCVREGPPMTQVVAAYSEYPSTTGEYIAKGLRQAGCDVAVLKLQGVLRGRPNLILRYLEKDLPLISWLYARRWLRRQRFEPDLFLWIESPRFVEVKVKRPFPCLAAAYVIATHVLGTRLRSLAQQYDIVFVAQKDDIQSFQQAA